MKNSFRGMILIIFSLTLSFMALLVMAHMESLFLFYKNMRQMMEIQGKYTTMETEAERFLKNKNTACVLAAQGADEIIKLLGARHCSFSLDAKKYIYLLEDLGEFSCLRIRNKFSSHHWRITISDNEIRPVILQIRYAEPARHVPCIESNSRTIEEGVQSWRLM